MNKKQLLLMGILLCCSFTQAQTTTTQSNGVVVHQAEGVEGKTKPNQNTPIVKTINDWNLSQILDAEPYFYSKLNAAATEEDKKYYTDQWNTLQKRKAELMNAAKSQSNPTK